MADDSYRVLVTNPVPCGTCCGDIVARDSISRAYIIVPDDDGTYLLYLEGAYIGEGSSLPEIETIIHEDGARSESVLIENTDGGYTVYTYKSPKAKKKNPKRKTAKRKATKKKAAQEEGHQEEGHQEEGHQEEGHRQA
jgi:hypothetical protein